MSRLITVTPRFSMLEMAGSLGDMGTLLPLALGLILVTGLNPLGLFLSVGLYYLFSGMYYGVTTPVQPMKVIGAYAVAAGLTAQNVTAAGLLMAALLFLVAMTGAMCCITRFVKKPVIRGVQLSTGALLMAEGVRLIAGTSAFQKLKHVAEPALTIQDIGSIPIGILIGIASGLTIFSLINNKRFPAAIVVIAGGALLGLVLGPAGKLEALNPGLHLPDFLPFKPTWSDFSFALLVLVLPQLPMTLGNAVIANADLSEQYFGEDSRRVTPKALCITMAIANVFSAVVGGMPLCHGAGGLAAHYRFGARTWGSNAIIGVLFILGAIIFGDGILALVTLVPLSVLGVLLLFAGSELALTISDVETRGDLFVCVLILGITLAANLAVGFLVGIGVSLILQSGRLKV